MNIYLIAVYNYANEVVKKINIYVYIYVWQGSNEWNLNSLF